MRSLIRTLALASLVFADAGMRAQPVRKTFITAGRPVAYEVFRTSNALAPLLIFLPGASGPCAEIYRSEAAAFAAHGFEVLLLHYYDATPSRLPFDANYASWAKALEDLVHDRIAAAPAQRTIFVLGISLGGSIALAAGSQGLPVRAIAEWSGALPDTFFYHFRTMPPLLILHGGRDQIIPVIQARQLVRLCTLRKLNCANRIYPEQSHVFTSPARNDAEQRTIQFFNEH